MEEIWKDVIGYEDLFSISIDGKLFSKRTMKVLKQYKHKSGYMLAATKIGGRNGINKCFKIHRLVAEAFLEPPPNDLILQQNNTYYSKVLVNHKDGNKANNHASNLEWCSYSENMKHAYLNNLAKPSTGAKNGSSFFLSEEERQQAYIDFINSGLSMRKYAKIIGVRHSVISRLVRDYGDKV